MKTSRVLTFAVAVLISVDISNAQSVSAQTSGNTGAAPSGAAAALFSNTSSAGSSGVQAGAAHGVASVGAPANYQLNVNDQIAVEVFGEDDLRTAVRVNSDGNVSLPLLGSVRVAG